MQVGNNDEFKGSIPANTLTPGTYYYAYRYQLNGGPFVYGGYEMPPSGGGIWDGINNVSGVLTVNACPSVAATATLTTICQNTSTTISASSANPNYTYEWNPGSLTGSPQMVTPASTTTYIVTATDTGISCSSTASVTIDVNVSPSDLTVTPTNTTLCAGAKQNIVIQSIDISGKIGSGNLTNTTSTPYKAFWGGNKSQILYTASELTNLGMTTGKLIKSSGFELLSGTPLLMNNFEIKAGFVSNTTLGSVFISGANNLVFFNAAYVPSSGSGPIDYLLVSPLAWDGVSSLLIETCFNNNNGGAGSSNSLSVESTTVSSGLNLYRSQDNTVDVCTNAVSPSSSTNRPNLRVTFGDNSQFTWAPFGGLYLDMAASIDYMGENTTSVYASPITSSQYTITSLASNGCTKSLIIDVNVEGNIVKSTADAGLHSLRSVYNCITEGDTITYDQPTTVSTVLTTPLDITKSVTIQGLSDTARPEISVPALGISISSGKTLTLENVDVKSTTPNPTFTGTGDVSITGKTVSKQ